ncbi:DUF6185 family protein [Streptomyces sp. NPDC051940]|uniref:DUF6185 family protein n=1 Tax=Streptomyces sp. NPDC051940 TaxID=3155675 RepID=UPI003449AA80
MVPAAPLLLRFEGPSVNGALAAGTVLAGLTFTGVFALSLRVWRTVRDRPVLRRHLVVPIVLGVAAAALTATMHFQDTVDSERQRNWLMDDVVTSLLPHALDFPSYFYDSIRYMWWLVILVAAVPVLRDLPASARVSDSVRVLVVLLGGIALQDWPDTFVGIPSPLIPLLTAIVLLGVMRLNRRRVLLDQQVLVTASAATAAGPTLAELIAGSTESVRGDLHAVALRYHALEQEGRKLDAEHRVTAEMNAAAYSVKRENLEAELRDLSRWPPRNPTALSLVAGQSAQPGQTVSTQDWLMPAGVTPVDVSLNVGPGPTPWQNGIQSAVLTTTLGLPVIAYLVYGNYGGSWWVDQLQGWFGPMWLVYNLLFCALPWAASGFLLGFFWRELPGKRGPVKVLSVAAAFTSAMVVDRFLCHVFDQPEPPYRWGVTGLLIIGLTVTGILMDGRALRRQRPSWATFWSPLVSVYRLGAAQTGLAFVVAQTAAIVGLWLQLRTGTESPAVAPAPSAEK